MPHFTKCKHFQIYITVVVLVKTKKEIEEMPYQFSKAELETMNLTIWVNSDRATFGKFDYDAESMSHSVSYLNSVRFHKPPQNRRDPIEFIIQSVAKLIDSVRGPISIPGTTLAHIPSPAVKDIRLALKSLRNNPEALLNEVLIETPWLTVKQPTHSTLICEVKDRDICYALPPTFEYLDVIHSEIYRTLMGSISKEYSDDVKRLLEHELDNLSSRASELTSEVIFEDELLRIARRIVKSPEVVSVGPVGRVQIETPEGECVGCDVYVDCATVNTDLVELLVAARALVPQYKLEEFIVNTVELKFGKYPTETKTLFKGTHVIVDFIKY